jgi:hypothetical protein
MVFCGSREGRARSWQQHSRKYVLSSSRSFMRGIGVLQRRCNVFTRFSTTGFSLPLAGMQNSGSNT